MRTQTDISTHTYMLHQVENGSPAPPALKTSPHLLCIGVSPSGANFISTNMGAICQSSFDTNDFLSLCFSYQAWTQSVRSWAAWFVLRFPLKWNMKCAGKQSSCRTHALVTTVNAKGTVVSSVTGCN